MRAHRVLSRELKLLREFYATSCSAYAQIADDLSASSAKRRKRQARNLNRAETTLREVVLVRAISALESFLTDAVRDIFLVTKAPFMDKSVQFTMSQEDMIANSTPTRIFQRIIDRETRRLTSGGLIEFIKYYKRRFDIDLSGIHPGYKVLNEYHDRRHLLVHRMGQTDETYRRKYDTKEKKVSIKAAYVEKLLDDLQTFCSTVNGKLDQIVAAESPTTAGYSARLVADIHLLKREAPECLRPDFQFWANDEYVVMADVLLGTGPGSDGRVRYYFSGSDAALQQLKRYLRVEQRRRTSISLVYISDLTKPRKVKRVLTEEILNQVKELLPAQPWPTGTHKRIAETLGLPNREVSAAIDALINRGDFKHQIDGVVTDKR